MSQSVPKWQYRFGLIGRRLDYSFSPSYFAELFSQLDMADTHSYDTWPLLDEEAVCDFLSAREFRGCNVTIPYKLIAAECCDILVGFASTSGAVNTIHQTDNLLIGYNTDVYGVIKTISDIMEAPKLLSGITRVLILGSGGASKAVQLACQTLRFSYTVVSRQSTGGDETYESLNQGFNLDQFDLIINTTPLGSVDHLDACPDLQYDQISEKHIVFDLIYNPKKTLLLERAENAGAKFCNGELMLQEQANLAWNVWK